MRIDKDLVFNDPVRVIKDLEEFIPKNADNTKFLREVYSKFLKFENHKKWLVSNNLTKCIETFFEHRPNGEKLFENSKAIGLKKSLNLVVNTKKFTSLVSTQNNIISIIIPIYNFEFEAIKFDFIIVTTYDIIDSSVYRTYHAISYNHKDLEILGNTEKKKKLFDIADEFSFQIIHSLVFLLFVDVQYIKLDKKQKYKPKNSPPIKNITKRPFTVIDIGWDSNLQIIQGSKVKSHWRQQRVGPGREKIKLTLIPPHSRKPYSRRAGKSLVLNQ